MAPRDPPRTVRRSHPTPSPAVRPARARRRRRRGDGARALRGGATPRPAEAGARRPTSASVPADAGADDTGTELENEHGVVVEKPHGGAHRPRACPSPTTPTVPDVPRADHARAGGRAPGARARRRQRRSTRVERRHRGRQRQRRRAPVPSGAQSFSSAGGSITVDGERRRRSRWRRARPAAGFGAEVHDNGPTPGRGAVHERGSRVAHPGRARQWRPHVGDHPARVSAATDPAQPPVRGRVPRPTARAGTPPPASARCAAAISTRLCTTRVVAELDRGDGHRRVADGSTTWSTPTRSTRPPSSCCCSYADALGGDEAAPVEPVAQLGSRERVERLEVEAVPRQLVGDRDLAGPGPAVLGDRDDHRERERQDHDADDDGDHVRQPSISVARSKSRSVRPPASWVESATRTLR